MTSLRKRCGRPPGFYRAAETVARTRLRPVHCPHSHCPALHRGVVVALNKIACPECGTGLKSATGFKVGQFVRCPKCKDEFEVEPPEVEEEEFEERKPSRKPVRVAVEEDNEDDEDEDERPTKKKKKRRDDDDEGAKSNIAFYIRLGVLLIILIGLAIAFAVLGPGGLNKQN